MEASCKGLLARRQFVRCCWYVFFSGLSQATLRLESSEIQLDVSKETVEAEKLEIRLHCRVVLGFGLLRQIGKWFLRKTEVESVTEWSKRSVRLCQGQKMKGKFFFQEEAGLNSSFWIKTKMQLFHTRPSTSAIFMQCNFCSTQLSEWICIERFCKKQTCWNFTFLYV